MPQSIIHSTAGYYSNTIEMPFSTTQDGASNASYLHQQRNNAGQQVNGDLGFDQRFGQKGTTLRSMRKHHSLDGSRFLDEQRYNPAEYPMPTSSIAPQNSSKPFEQQRYSDFPSGYDQQAALQQNTKMSSADNYRNDHHDYYPQNSAFPPLDYDFSGPFTFSGLPHTNDPNYLKRELLSQGKKFNYLMNSIRNFWSPELKKERQKRKEEALRISQMQYKICLQSSEIQVVRDELSKREKEIAQLLSADTDLAADMESELRRLRGQLATETRPPRDFTDKLPSTHEWQTMKTKLERSEVTLAEKARELADCELRLKCAEEQRAETEKRGEILARSNADNEAQLKLLSEDLEVLRGKLENKNKQLEGKEGAVKRVENELQATRAQLLESAQGVKDGEHRISQLSHRIDQLETLIREKDAQIDRLKQRLMKEPGMRMEVELQQRLENALEDKRKLETLVDSQRHDSEAERQQQLNIFHEETRQLRATIDSLQKELADRHMLITSQNEKISQFDGNGHSSGDQQKGETNRDKEARDQQTNRDRDEEFEETRKEVDRLLRIVQFLEREKFELCARLERLGTGTTAATVGLRDSEFISKVTDKAEDVGTELRRRINELEEALKESVGITADKERSIDDQKQMIQQLSSQIAEMFRHSDVRSEQRHIRDIQNKLAETQKLLEEERTQFQRQLLNLRKELAMALIVEKEAAIGLIQNPHETLKEKLDIFVRQKEQLKHYLLSQDATTTASVMLPFSATYPQFGQLHDQQQQPLLMTNFGGTNNGLLQFKGSLQHQQQFSTPMAMPIQLPPPSAYGAQLHRPCTVQTAAVQSIGISAPASLNYYAQEENGEDDGVWA